MKRRASRPSSRARTPDYPTIRLFALRPQAGPPSPAGQHRRAGEESPVSGLWRPHRLRSHRDGLAPSRRDPGCARRAVPSASVSGGLVPPRTPSRPRSRDRTRRRGLRTALPHLSEPPSRGPSGSEVEGTPTGARSPPIPTTMSQSIVLNPVEGESAARIVR